MNRDPVLCLNMIVKDESKIVERLVDSVAPYIGYYVVCDTGSSDGTPELIRERFAKKGVAGEVHAIPFVNFERARNAALEVGRKATADFDYFLLADADMELVVEDSSFARHLSAAAYSVKQQSGSFAYYNPRLLKRDVNARYVGPTHEYLKVEGLSRLDGLKFRDHACGSSRSIKIERDTKLLLEALRENPDDVRSMFYLAQTCRDGGLIREAAAWYELRCKAGGYAEEAWYARYQLALCAAKLGDEKKFVSESLKAFEQMPTRAEPLYEVARYYRLRGQYQTALVFAQAAAKVSYPVDDSLFVDEEIYLSGILEELSVSGFYSRHDADREQGRAACFALSVSTRACDVRVHSARTNSFFYAPAAHEIFGETKVVQLKVEVPPGYSCYNPSIASRDGRLFCILRSANYRLENGVFLSNDADRIYRTQNYFLELDHDLKIKAYELIRTGHEDRPVYATQVRGYEDCRLFSLNGNWMCTATVLDANPRGVCDIALFCLNDQSSIERVAILPSPDANRHEKNWLPLIDQDELFLIYSTDPTVIFHCDTKTGLLETVSNRKPRLRLDHLRGGSQAIAVNDGWLYLTHEAIDFAENDRAYLHRFVFLDRQFALSGVTDPFVFLEGGVEFCAGLTIDPSSGRLIASFGQFERSAYLMSISLDGVLSKLQMQK
jgi:tetratricopeptide (TPR) repeat protein